MPVPFQRIYGRLGLSPHMSGTVGLLDEVDRFVGCELEHGRSAWRARRGEHLLGRVLRARITARREMAGGSADQIDADLDLAAETLRATLEQWHGRRSHALEWTIIALIALDIAIHLWI